jgi:AraC-like DNA-binding protein
MSAVTVRALCRAASTVGLDVNALLHEAGIASDVIDDRESRIPERLAARLWSAMERSSGDPSFGLRVAQAVHPGGLELVDYACRSAATLGSALDLLLQHGRFLADSLSIAVTHERERTRLRIDLPMSAPASTRHASEAALGLLVLRARHFTGHDLTPREVRFRHSKPADLTLHREIFRAPTMFMVAEDELVIDRASLDLPIPTHDATLREILVSHARTILGERPRATNVVNRMRRAVEEGLRTRDVDLHTLARKMHLSPRTLQRRLAEAGTTHQGLTDSVRREMALRLLESDVPIAEAAYLLGFSEASAFHRAFKRWTGETPAEFRRRKR